MNRADLRKLIEACREEADLQSPDFHPLAEHMALDPALRQSWERTRRFDRSIREALRDVPVPEGLEQRIVNSLPAAEPEEGEKIAISWPRRRSTRWSRWGVALGAVAALVLAMFFAWPSSEPSLSNEVELAKSWIGLLRESEWSSSPAPPEPSPPLAQLAVRPYRWQLVRGLPGALTVVCYELPSAGPRALLFVARAKPRAGLPLAPPPSAYPVPPWSVGVWRGESAVYVLAVQGGPPQYQQLLRARSSWVALHPGTSRRGCLTLKV